MFVLSNTDSGRQDEDGVGKSKGKVKIEEMPPAKGQYKYLENIEVHH